MTAALVIAIALVPMLQWFERRGVPAKLAAGLCVIIFLAAMVFVIGSIVIPAIDWIALVPQRIEKVRAALEPVLDLYKNLDTYIARIAVADRDQPQERATRFESRPRIDVVGLLTTSAPHLLIQLFFALLVIFFFLAGWTSMRKRTIVSRGSFEGALTTARVIQEVVDATSTYIGTITIINVGLGALTALILWFLGMESPIMWGGIVAVANYIPYLGPIVSALLLFVGGLMTFPDAWTALGPPAVFIGLHLIEANFFTPDGGRREARDQPAGDPRRPVLLGVGVGDDRRAAGGAAADHHQDDIFGRRNARHRRIPVRARHADPCRRARRGRNRRTARNGPGHG